LPTVTMPSIGVRLTGDHLDPLRARDLPIIGRVVDGNTVLDLRSVPPGSDPDLIEAITALAPTSATGTA